ncbi:hypothetical protein BN946_scf185007.g82 [Trametes cinnabarina]|uniref:BTB domain-containing protein n=1 Tax=Pycnoporus cinnabarinus TaxID=5643 RepID=A0A060SKR6_PYCCI|nr:hypothetical protein BN946_scf185007.g82 [Trametes cinnabarina]
MDSATPHLVPPRSPTPFSPRLPAAEAYSILKDPDYWFEDGNLVIISAHHRPRANPIAFRVHRGVLLHHSAKLLNLLGPILSKEKRSHGGKTLAGCPAVHFSDSPDGVLPFADAAALIRLGHKYGVARVLTLGTKALFPDDNPWGRILDLTEEVIEAVNLFTAIDCAPARLMALYRCTRLENKLLVTGARRKDGFVETLRPEDLALCLGARELFAVLRMNHVFTTMALRSRATCQTNTRCDRYLSHHRPKCFDIIRGGVSLVFADWAYNTSICKPCRKLLAGREAQFQTNLLEELPTLIGVDVENWDHTWPVRIE